MNIFSLFPEWSGGMGIRYTHNTVIHTATNRREQRQSLRSLPIREITFHVFEDAVLTVRQINQLLYTVRSEIAVPIYTEQFKCTNSGNLNLVQSLGISNIENFYNLNTHQGGLIIIDRTGVIPHEFVNILSVSSSVVVVDAIQSSIDSANALFYPAIIGMLSEFPSFSHTTDGLSDFDITFREKRALPIYPTGGDITEIEDTVELEGSIEL